LGFFFFFFYIFGRKTDVILEKI